MTIQPFRFVLWAIMVCFTVTTPNLAAAASEPAEDSEEHLYCGVTDSLLAKQFSNKFANPRYRTFAANLNIGEPRTVRMIYFLPNDQPYRADEVDSMKSVIRKVQTFYAEQMEAHGYGKATFRVETDLHGDPIVHRVDGQYPNYDYHNQDANLFSEIKQAGFDLSVNVYLIVKDVSINRILGITAFGNRNGKNGGYAMVPGGFGWITAAHELGHAFGLGHDFRDVTYIMSYGPGRAQLSACHAEYLSVHPYFNPDTPIKDGTPPTIELISSPQYPTGSKSVSIRLKVRGSAGLHQVLLTTAAPPYSSKSVKACRRLNGEREVFVEFDYDGASSTFWNPQGTDTSLSNPLVHSFFIETVDTDGNVIKSGRSEFLLFSEALQPLTKISGDNQQSFPNARLPSPFVIELRNLNNGSAREGVPVTFTITAGGGMLSVARTQTNLRGRAESILTLGANLGTTTVAVSAGELTVTFNAVAGGAVDIPDSNLRAEIERALNKAPGTAIAPAEIGTIMPYFEASRNNISDLTGLEGATNLKRLELWSNSISDISALTGLTNLTWLDLANNAITDISALVGLTNLRTLYLGDNSVSDILPLVENTGLGSGDGVFLTGNPLSYQSIYTHIPSLQSRDVEVDFYHRTPHRIRIVSGDNQGGLPGTILEKPFVVEVQDQKGVPFEGVPITFTVSSGRGTLSTASATTNSDGRAESILTLGHNLGRNSVRVRVEGISPSETFTAIGKRPEFDLSVPAGISLIHVPLRVASVDETPLKIATISDLYDALGGRDKVNYLVTRDSQRWHTYFSPQNRGTSVDRTLTDDLGVITVMKDAVKIRLVGDSLGINSRSAIMLHAGTNLVGIPLRDSRITHVSDLLSLQGIQGNVRDIFVWDNGSFKEVALASDTAYIPVTGGQSFIMNAQDAATVAISGYGWYNAAGTTAAPVLALTGIEVRDATPVLALSGSIVDEVIDAHWRDRDAPLTTSGFHVTVKNHSTGKSVTAVTAEEGVLPSIGVSYQVTAVDMGSERAARIGDVLEVSAETSNPLVRVRPLRYTVTAVDVMDSRIQLPELVAYEIPTETALLPNYPNPFNPETWIPYQLAENADVTLTIYDARGVTIRHLDLGHQSAGYYTDRGKAAYWDGRNEYGEQAASGVYFYNLSTGVNSPARKMLIIK